MKIIFMSLMISLLFVSILPIIHAENVPQWVKNTAGWWAADAISEKEFVNAIEFLIKEGIIDISSTYDVESQEGVPEWVKNTAGWWAADAISATEFLNAIVYLIKVGIIGVESSKSPELIAEMWVNGDINDDEFLANVEQLIETGNLSIPDNSVTKTSQLPDWLVNNAGWWAARIFTNSDFDFDPGYVKEELYPCIELSTDTECFTRTINSHGFRGDEFEKEKPSNTFRIFAVGGSTTNGAAANDDKTWPAHLQQIIDEKTTGEKIEVINAGIAGATSEQEYNMIKNKITLLDPDLVIVYDGWNDWGKLSVEKTIQNWESFCKLGKNEGFDTVIVVQPLTITGNRVLTEQETTNSFLVLTYLQKSQQYVDAFKELDNMCTKTADFRKVFDYVQGPIFWDDGHTMSFGNKIIAENIFSVISPIYFDQTYSVTQSDLQIESNKLGTGVVYAVGADLSDKNFDNLNLQNAVFDKADLSNTSFKNAKIDGARFTFTNLDNSNLLDRTDLSNINLAGIDLSMKSLKGKDLSGANLSYVDLSEHDLTGTNLSDTFLLRTNLSGIDLRSTILTGADFRYAYLSESKLPDSVLVNNNFDYAELKDIDFSGKDLSGSSFKQASLEGSYMQNTNLSNAKFIQVDFTKIKNKSLAGADLSLASLAHSNLSDVDLSGVTVLETNFWKADLSDVDFTDITDASVFGSKFYESNLASANFEGVDLTPKEIVTNFFKNKASLVNLNHQALILNLYGEFETILILSSEVRGNDLVLEVVLFNNFKDANLENANFKDADLRYTGFYLADLTSAILSGADLRNAYFGNADLSNANLEGANLEGAILDNAILTGADLSGANLNCIGHKICTVN